MRNGGERGREEAGDGRTVGLPSRDGAHRDVRDPGAANEREPLAHPAHLRGLARRGGRRRRREGREAGEARAARDARARAAEEDAAARGEVVHERVEVAVDGAERRRVGAGRRVRRGAQVRACAGEGGAEPLALVPVFVIVTADSGVGVGGKRQRTPRGAEARCDREHGDGPDERAVDRGDGEARGKVCGDIERVVRGRRRRVRVVVQVRRALALCAGVSARNEFHGGGKYRI